VSDKDRTFWKPGRRFDVAVVEDDKMLSGFNVEFMSEDQGKFKELLFKQPNGNFKATGK
jgi:hypothetical protein